MILIKFKNKISDKRDNKNKLVDFIFKFNFSKLKKNPTIIFFFNLIIDFLFKCEENCLKFKEDRFLVK